MNESTKTAGQKKTTPILHFLYLLPFFFVLHGFTENYSLIPINDSLFLILIYLVATGIIFFLSWLPLKSISKAALFSFLIFSYHFFFGSWHDGVKNLFGDIFFTRYSFILPFSLVVFIIAFVYIKKRKDGFARLFLFFNLVLVALIAIDVIVLISKVSSSPQKPKNYSGLAVCDSCAKPDIYLIVADEYAGEEELKTVFYYDDSTFSNALTNRGFHVVKKSKSNYNFTPFSMASTLNMDFLPVKDPNHTIGDVTHIMEMIKYNTFTNFLFSSGYEIFNNSVFDIDKEPSQTQATFLPLKTVYITSQTFLSRLKRDISYNLITTFKLDWAIRKGMYTNNKNNELLYKSTLQTASNQKHPKFSYTHLMLPHFPFYYNENGKPNDYHLLFDGESKERYLSYLKYANKKYLNLIDHIFKSSSAPPVIIFMSDHGFRHKSDSPFKDFSFSNLISVYLPAKGYKSFYDGMSNINLLRIVLNKNFNQHLPLLKDSTTFLHD
jgi:hypothetical protein